MELIVLDVLIPHDRILSIRALARDLSLNFNTVKKAYSELEDDDVIYTVIGSGTFIAENAMDNKKISVRAMEELKTAICSARANGLTKEQVEKLVYDTFSGFKKEDKRDD